MTIDKTADEFIHETSAFIAKIGRHDGAIQLRRKDAPGSVTVRPGAWQAAIRSSRQREASIIFSGNEAEIVLTATRHGIKEDIVFSRAPGDSTTFEWELALSEGLEARLLANGGIGIYGKANDARPRLLYRVPAPLIREATGQERKDIAQFALNGSRLMLSVRELAGLTYPITVDPTILMDFTADFALGGNNEDGVESDGDQVKRQKVMRGVNGWTTTTALPSPRADHASVEYNGHIYVIGGNDSTITRSDVQVAAFNSDGSIGAWHTTTALPATRAAHSAVAYNGYLYVIGGSPSAGAAGAVSDVLAARILASGDLGAWTSVGQLPSALAFHASVAYNGRVYVLGGSNNSPTNPSATQAVITAPVHADGSLGDWTDTTPLPATTRYGHSAVVHDGRIYVIGGIFGNGSLSGGDVQFAPINADGSVGAWTQLGGIPGNGRFGHRCLAHG